MQGQKGSRRLANQQGSIKCLVEIVLALLASYLPFSKNTLFRQSCLRLEFSVRHVP